MSYANNVLPQDWPSEKLEVQEFAENSLKGSDDKIVIHNIPTVLGLFSSSSEVFIADPLYMM